MKTRITQIMMLYLHTIAKSNIDILDDNRILDWRYTCS